jgi:glycosyltransferase involved in cell wall biosynthesis
MNKCVSIIIPVYNVEKYISRCIESCINQTYAEVEVILVDDKSSDSSGKICDNYALKDRRINVIHCANNSGPSTARNIGMKNASGDYFIFVDSDDYIEKNAVEILIEAEKKYQADLVVASNMLAESDGNVENAKNAPILKGTRFFRNKEAIEELVLNNRIISYSVCSKLWKREHFFCGTELKFPFPENMKYEDKVLTCTVIKKLRNVICIPDVIYHYQLREGSIIHSRSLFNSISLWNACKKKEEICFDLNNQDIIDKCICERFDALISVWSRLDYKDSIEKKLFNSYCNEMIEYSKKNYNKYSSLQVDRKKVVVAFFTRSSNIFSFWLLKFAYRLNRLKIRVAK